MDKTKHKSVPDGKEIKKRKIHIIIEIVEYISNSILSVAIIKKTQVMSTFRLLSQENNWLKNFSL